MKDVRSQPAIVFWSHAGDIRTRRIKNIGHQSCQATPVKQQYVVVATDGGFARKVKFPLQFVRQEETHP